MTIAKKGSAIIVNGGRIATHCRCCGCGECPQSLDAIAEDLTATVTITQYIELFLNDPNPFFAGQVIPCTFSRMQNATTLGGSQERFAVCSSDPSVSQSSGISSVSPFESTVSSAVLAVLSAMQKPQKLVELFIPCHDSLSFVVDKYVIIRLYGTWRWFSDNPFSPQPFYDEYDMRTNLDSTLSSARPSINCERALSQPQNLLGYPFAYQNTGQFLPGVGYCEIQLEVNPLP